MLLRLAPTMNPKFKQIVTLFRKLPGVGPRQAARFVFALLEKPEKDLQELGSTIFNLKNIVKFCSICHNIANSDKCEICEDSRRDKTKIMAIERATDLDSVEKTGAYKGLYHVLGGAISALDGIDPDHLNIRSLQERIKESTSSGNKIELIVATNPNAPGETTSLYIYSLLKDTPNLSITRLGRGLASGSHLEYADEITLKHALEYRK